MKIFQLNYNWRWTFYAIRVHSSQVCVCVPVSVNVGSDISNGPRIRNLYLVWLKCWHFFWYSNGENALIKRQMNEMGKSLPKWIINARVKLVSAWVKTNGWLLFKQPNVNCNSFSFAMLVLVLCTGQPDTRTHTKHSSPVSQHFASVERISFRKSVHLNFST